MFTKDVSGTRGRQCAIFWGGGAMFCCAKEACLRSDTLGAAARNLGCAGIHCGTELAHEDASTSAAPSSPENQSSRASSLPRVWCQPQISLPTPTHRSGDSLKTSLPTPATGVVCIKRLVAARGVGPVTHPRHAATPWTSPATPGRRSAPALQSRSSKTPGPDCCRSGQSARLPSTAQFRQKWCRPCCR
jgi:hypothetical protein